MKTGAEMLFRSLEENQVSKILNLSLGGVLIDQIEELDPGDAGERIFDTLLGRLSDPRGPRKLLAVANPAGVTSWQYRRLIDEASRDPYVHRVHFTLRDNAANLPADYVAAMEATKKKKPNWYRSYILGEWGAFEGQAFAEFDPAIHAVEPFEIPTSWERFESMDHGYNNPTAWLLWVVDYDGNVVVADEYYSSELVSKHAPEILRRRKKWWEANRDSNTCYADPSISAQHGLSTEVGRPASVQTEYADLGIGLSPANNDRITGYLRLCELLHVEPGRIAPPWASVPSDVGGAPRLYVFSTCTHLIGQLKSAPIAAEGVNAGEAVDAKWESAHGHAVASARYGSLSRPSPSDRPERDPNEPFDLRREAVRRQFEAEKERDEFEDVYGAEAAEWQELQRVLGGPGWGEAA